MLFLSYVCITSLHHWFVHKWTLVSEWTLPCWDELHLYPLECLILTEKKTLKRFEHFCEKINIFQIRHYIEFNVWDGGYKMKSHLLPLGKSFKYNTKELHVFEKNSSSSIIAMLSFKYILEVFSFWLYLIAIIFFCFFFFLSF